MPVELIYTVDGRQLTFPLDKPGQDEVVIGRSQDADLTLTHASMSRRHARLFREGGVWRVVDLGSKNGTRVNELPNSDKVLQHGDRIHLHDFTLTFSDGSAAIEAPPLPTPFVDSPTTDGGQTVFRSTVNFSSLAANQPPEQKVAPGSPDRLQRLVSIISAASETILTSTSLDETFQRMLTLVFDHLPVQRGFIALWDEQKKELVTKCVKHSMGVGEQIRFSRTIGEKVYRDKMAVLTMDAQMDDRFAAGQSIAALGIRSAMAAPLWRGDKVDGLIYVDTPLQTKAFDAFDLDILSALGNHLAVAIEQSRLQQAVLEKEKLERELSVARDIQMGILPKVMPTVMGYDLAGISRPADQTGGDTFDLITIDPQKLMLLLGDATGHGIGPALSVTQVRSMLRMAMRLGASLDDAFQNINDQLAADLADNRFVTAFLGLLDNSTHRVNYHAGGQGPLMHFHAATGQTDWHGASTVPMGFMAGMPMKACRTMHLEPGDILGLMTDGVFESENEAGDMYGEARVADLIRENRMLPMAQLVDLVLLRVTEFAGRMRQADDITILLVRRDP